MQKLISFSIFGDDDKYLIGLKKNLTLVKQYYPDWSTIVYYKNVTTDYINSIKNDVILRDISQCRVGGIQARFLANDEPNTERFISRDADSRINQREVDAVNEWINSGKILHIMRDHPWHQCTIMGGMWGMVCQKDFNMTSAILEYMKDKDIDQLHSPTGSWIDQDFLHEVVYAKYGQNSKIHTAYCKYEDWAENFPSELIEQRFIGEIYDKDDIRNGHHLFL